MGGGREGELRSIEVVRLSAMKNPPDKYRLATERTAL